MIVARSIGPYSKLTRQPLVAAAAAPRIARPTIEALIARGARHVAHELLTAKSDDAAARVAWFSAIVEGEAPSEEPNLQPASVTAIECHLLALGFDACLRRGTIELATDDMIRSRSSGMVYNPETYQGPDHVPVDGGLFGPSTFGSTDDEGWQQFGHLELAAEIRHPWVPSHRLTTWPVLPTAHRPLVRLADGRYAGSDANDLYRRLFADPLNPQAAVESLVDNRHGVIIVDSGRRLASLASGLAIALARSLAKSVDFAACGPAVAAGAQSVCIPRDTARTLLAPWIYECVGRVNHIRSLREVRAMVAARDAKAEAALDSLLEQDRIALVVSQSDPSRVMAARLTTWNGSEIGLPDGAGLEPGQVCIHLPIGPNAISEARALGIAAQSAPPLNRFPGWLASLLDAVLLVSPDVAPARIEHEVVGSLRDTLVAAVTSGQPDPLTDPLAQLAAGLRPWPGKAYWC